MAGIASILGLMGEKDWLRAAHLPRQGYLGLGDWHGWDDEPITAHQEEAYPQHRGGQKW